MIKGRQPKSITNGSHQRLDQPIADISNNPPIPKIPPKTGTKLADFLTVKYRSASHALPIIIHAESANNATEKMNVGLN